MDEIIQDGESSCCGASIYLGGICSDCKEHCDNVEMTCNICEDTGEVEKIVFDENSKTYVSDGYEPCICQTNIQTDD